MINKLVNLVDGSNDRLVPCKRIHPTLDMSQLALVLKTTEKVDLYGCMVLADTFGGSYEYDRNLNEITLIVSFECVASISPLPAKYL